MMRRDVDDRLRTWVESGTTVWPKTHRRHWQLAKKYGTHRLMVIYRGTVRCRATGSLEYLLQLARFGRKRTSSIIGRCWIEWNHEPASAFVHGRYGNVFTRESESSAPAARRASKGVR